MAATDNCLRLAAGVFITHLRQAVTSRPKCKRVLQCACDIIVADTSQSKNGGMRRNWCLFIGVIPLILGTFITMLDNMWKGRFMAAMIIVHHANGIYCPYAHSIYANWGCRGIEAATPQVSCTLMEAQKCDKSRNGALTNIGFCLENHGFCAGNDGFCIENADFCIENAEFCI